jgi:hypothetical protein
MLTLEEIMRNAKFNAQYGEPEQTFSPRWHAENPVPAHVGAVLKHEREKVGKEVNVCLRYVKHVSGDITIWDDDGSALPEGSTFLNE